MPIMTLYRLGSQKCILKCIAVQEPPAVTAVHTEDYKWRHYADKWTIVSRGQLVKSIMPIMTLYRLESQKCILKCMVLDVQEPPAVSSVFTEDYKWRHYAYKWTIVV